MESVAAAASFSSSSSSSGSSSTPPPPSLLPAGEYEVFLSFRGPDVRNTFADHLYTFLSRSKIRTFRDEEELPKGEEISPSLVRAIGESKIYIPIFTENYASSKWCLQELAQMVECWKQGKKGHLFLPIFYFVDPRDVRHQQGPYEQAFEQHAQKHELQTVEEWKEALRVVGKLEGWHVTESDGQGAVVDQILSKVELHLRSIYTLVTDELVGIDTHLGEVMKLLNLDSNNPRVVGIHGMGGIGKTTLSKAVYNKISTLFDRCCYLEDVREILTSDGVVVLQNKFISSILNGDYQVRNVSEGINLIKERVCKHKILLVFDDIDDRFEFNQTLGKLGDFSLKSRFIFTTRDKRVFDFFTGCKLYEVGEMSSHYSVQLFSKHAFGVDHPPEDYATLTEEFVKVAAGLPLALKVFGSLLFRKDRKFWEVKLTELQSIPSSTENKVQERLKISYNELTVTEKQIFLDIACCFIGMNYELLCHMWSNCNFHPESKINTLVLRSLMKIDDRNQFWMHDHIRDLGRTIVKEEDIRHPYRRSRIWSHEDALDLLRNEEGNNHVEVLRIDMKYKDYVFTDKAFEKLFGLRYLQVSRGKVMGDFSKILPDICMLQLHHCELIPTDFNMKKLAVLDLKRCNVKDDWKGWKRLRSTHKLKAINLESCTKLKRVPDLSQCESLEAINVEGCYNMDGPLYIVNFMNLKTLKIARTRITEFTGDIQMLQQLEEIDASDTNLREVPVEIDKLSSLKILFLASFRNSVPHKMEVPRLPTSLKFLSISSEGGIPNLLELKDLEYLKFTHSHRLEIPGDIWKLRNLKVLMLWMSPRDVLRLVQTLPSSLTCLVVVVDCDSLSRLPSLANLNNLTVLQLRCFAATEIHGLGKLRALESLEITDAPNLNNLDGLEYLLLLTSLNVKRCGVLEKMPSLANLIKLQSLDISGCTHLEKVTGLGKLVSLERLTMVGCTSIRKLPADLSELKKLRDLRASGCTNLIDATGIGRLESLWWLDMSDCNSIKELPDLSSLKNLVTLYISRCTELTGITGIQRLESLHSLYMMNCRSIKELRDLSGLHNLKKLDVRGCIELVEVTGMEKLQSVEHLDMYGCSSIKELGNLSGLQKLRQLDIRGCTQITGVKGLEELERLEILRMDKKLIAKYLLQWTTRYGKRLVNRVFKRSS